MQEALSNTNPPVNRSRTIFAAASVAAVAAGLAGAAHAAGGAPELVSRASGDGAAGNGPSLFPSVSGDGRRIAFRSEASNLNPDDTDTERDIFVRDRRTGETILVSRASGAGGEKGNRPSYNPRISADGRYVAFRSNATNLHPDDTDTVEDVYVRDLETNQTILVSRAGGAQGAKGTGGSFNPSISADGRRVAFRSEAANLHPDDTDTVEDVYVRDLETNQTILVSRAGGATGPKGIGPSSFPFISADGRRVAFRSEAANLNPNDTDTIEDIFVRDLESSETILASRAAGATGAKGNARSTFVSLSADGRLIAFDSLATNLHPDDPDDRADVFLRDLRTDEVSLVSRAEGAAGAKGDRGSAEPSISGDGRFVAFHSVATNLDPADVDPELDVFVRDVETSRTILISGAVTGEADGRSFEPWISADGRLVAFHSEADNLHPDDMAATSDVFAAAVPRAPQCLGEEATIVAAAGAVTLGTAERDVIVGTAGDDQIRSGGGDDLICSGDGADEIVTADGADEVRGGGEADLVRTGRGLDRALGGGGPDRLSGGRGSDRLAGGGGEDSIKGGQGADRLEGDGGADRLDGGGGLDRCRGGAGKDLVSRCERASR